MIQRVENKKSIFVAKVWQAENDSDNSTENFNLTYLK